VTASQFVGRIALAILGPVGLLMLLAGALLGLSEGSWVPFLVPLGMVIAWGAAAYSSVRVIRKIEEKD
jgi:hypothetical protein